MPPENHIPRKVLDNLDAIERLISKRRAINLFLDFDGTLVPIAPSPDKVVISPEVITILQNVANVDSVLVAIVTGRSLENIKSLLPIRNVRYVGNHGLEIDGVKRSEIVSNAGQVVRSIRKISDDLNNVLVTVPGAWVENKSLTASVHYRSVAAPHVPELNRLVGEITERYVERGIVKLSRGKKVIEIKPNVNWNKGKAVQWILRNIAKKRAATFYFGDDVTDEDAFRVLKSAVTVKVARDLRLRTEARYVINSPSEVRYFLHWLLDRVTESN